RLAPSDDVGVVHSAHAGAVDHPHIRTPRRDTVFRVVLCDAVEDQPAAADARVAGQQAAVEDDRVRLHRNPGATFDPDAAAEAGSGRHQFPHPVAGDVAGIDIFGIDAIGRTITARGKHAADVVVDDVHAARSADPQARSRLWRGAATGVDDLVPPHGGPGPGYPDPDKRVVVESVVLDAIVAIEQRD